MGGGGAGGATWFPAVCMLIFVGHDIQKDVTTSFKFTVALSSVSARVLIAATLRQLNAERLSRAGQPCTDPPRNCFLFGLCVFVVF